MLFYHIKENDNGGFTYHEFNAGSSGGYAFVFNDAYKDFNTLAEAVCYAKQRGGVDAYSY